MKKKKKGFELREVCGEHVIMAYGLENIDFSKIISLNGTAAYLWDAVGDGEFTADTLADLLCREYEVEHDRALADSRVVLTQWDEAGLLC